MHFGKQHRKHNIFESLKASFGGGSAPQQQQTLPSDPNKQQLQPPVAQPTNTEIDPAKVWESLFKPKEAPAKPEGGKPATSSWDTSPEALTAKFDGVNFSSILDPELATKALAGDAASLIQLIGQSAQAASMYAVKSSLDASKSGVEEFGKNFKSTLPNDFKKLSIEQALGADPVLSNPILKPTVELVANQLYSQFPNATTEDLKQAVQAFLKVQAETILPKPKEETFAGAIDFKALLGK